MSELLSRSVIAGTGFCVPEKVIDNNHFASYLETSDEWIRERTGIVARRWVAEGVGVTELALPAAADALKNAKIDASQVEAIVFATSTPDYAFPSSACILQNKLGVPAGATAFDVNAVCSGFVLSLIHI